MLRNRFESLGKFGGSLEDLAFPSDSQRPQRISLKAGCNVWLRELFPIADPTIPDNYEATSLSGFVGSCYIGLVLVQPVGFGWGQMSGHLATGSGVGESAQPARTKNVGTPNLAEHGRRGLYPPPHEPAIKFCKWGRAVNFFPANF